MAGIGPQPTRRADRSRWEGSSPPSLTCGYTTSPTGTSTITLGGLPHSRRDLRHPTAATVAVRDLVRERPSPIRPSPTPLAAGAASARAG